MELAGKLTSIEMEYALLDAQLALQKQRAIDAGINEFLDLQYKHF